MNALLSVRPQYADKILAKVKRFEYRKQIFKRPINEILIYSSFPIKKVVGKFKYRGYHHGTPEKIWNETMVYSGISKKQFFEYFYEKEKAYAIKIIDLTVFKPSVDPYFSNKSFRPPQSFMYIKPGDFE